VLEDIARTCDSVIVLRAGKVSAIQPVVPVRPDAGGDVRVRVEGDRDAFVRMLGGDVLSELDGDWVLVRGGGPAVQRAVRDAAVTAGVGLLELRPAAPTLAESLVEAMG
jgi:hypothetical protein